MNRSMEDCLTKLHAEMFAKIGCINIKSMVGYSTIMFSIHSISNYKSVLAFLDLQFLLFTWDICYVYLEMSKQNTTWDRGSSLQHCSKFHVNRLIWTAPRNSATKQFCQLWDSLGMIILAWNGIENASCGGECKSCILLHFIRPCAMAGYLASYYDVDRQKVGEGIVTSDEQIAYLFHVVQEYVRWACGSNNVKYFFCLSLTSTSANYIASTNCYHCGRP
jgi:hypothetical protein